MEIKTYGELIDWTRELHQNLAQCLEHCATRHEGEREKALLNYLSSHESGLAKIVESFEHHSTKNTLDTKVYDYLKHNKIEAHVTCDGSFAKRDSDGIFREVMQFQQQVMDLYQTMSEKAEISEARELLQELLEMEKNETMRLTRQVGRMDDL